MKNGAAAYDRAGFVGRLRWARERNAALTVADISEETGLSPASIARLSSYGCNCTPAVSTVLALAGALGVSPGWLAFGEGAP